MKKWITALVVLTALSHVSRDSYLFGKTSQQNERNEQNGAANGAAPAPDSVPAEQAEPAKPQDSPVAPSTENSPKTRSEETSSAERSLITLPVGQVIEVRIADNINSNRNKTGELFTGIVDPSVFVNEHVVIPRGTEAHIRMVEAEKGGKLSGKAEVKLELISLVLNGQKLDVDSDTFKKKQGALEAKAKAAASSAGSVGDVSTAGPAGAVAGPVIAVFHAPKVEMNSGTRVPFTLTTPFTFVEPPNAATQASER